MHDAITVDNSNIVDLGVLLLTLPPPPLIVLSVHSSNVPASFVVSVADLVGAVVGIVDDDDDVLSSTSIAKITNLNMTCYSYVATYVAS